MADSQRTAEYGQPDDPYSIPVTFLRKTTAELTAIITAKQVGIGTIYYDTTVAGFKVGIDSQTVSAVLTLAGLVSAVAITGGTINNTTIGATTRATGAFTTLASTATDSTGTPGNVTNNSANGRAAFAAAASTCVVTNSSVAAADTVLVTLLGAADTTLTAVVGVTVAAGSFTVTGNVAATATKGFMFTVIKA